VTDREGVFVESFAFRTGGDISREEVDELAASQAEAVFRFRREAFEHCEGLSLAPTADAPFHAGEGDPADPVGVPAWIDRRSGNDPSDIVFVNTAMATGGAKGANLTGIGPAPDG
jgi:hypothetical protein